MVSTDQSSAPASGSPALAVSRLTKRFGDRVAFRDVSFEVGHGEVFGFLGPNGAGKTTTVRTLGTLIAPTSGSASIAGMPLTPENGVEIRRRIAVMPESPGLYLRLTVTENLECFADLYEVPDPTGRMCRALRAVNLVDRAHDACGSLSKGLRQRVALARALLSDPQVLFLDEPTSGLDPVATRDIHQLIAALSQSGVTIFLTTHRLEEAERLCDRVAILNTTLRAIALPPSASAELSQEHLLLYMLGIPAIVPAAVAAYAVVGEREQGTLEPVLTTPIRREELLLGKALAAIVPSVAIAYAVYAVFLACVGLFARPAVASALLRGPDVLAQVLFTPLLAGWSIWVGMAISARASDVRVAQQLGILASLPTAVVAALIAFDVIHATLGLALGLAAALLLGNRLGWRIVSATFDRERLITGTK